MSGGHGGNRTRISSLKRRVLYTLSYVPVLNPLHVHVSVMESPGFNRSPCIGSVRINSPTGVRTFTAISNTSAICGPTVTLGFAVSRNAFLMFSNIMEPAAGSNPHDVRRRLPHPIRNKKKNTITITSGQFIACSMWLPPHHTFGFAVRLCVVQQSIAAIVQQCSRAVPWAQVQMHAQGKRYSRRSGHIENNFQRRKRNAPCPLNRIELHQASSSPCRRASSISCKSSR